MILSFPLNGNSQFLGADPSGLRSFAFILTFLQMPKQRLTALDIHALSSELQSIVSYRLQNIYGTYFFYKLTVQTSVHEYFSSSSPVQTTKRTYLLNLAIASMSRSFLVKSRLPRATLSRRCPVSEKCLTVVAKIFENSSIDQRISARNR